MSEQPKKAYHKVMLEAGRNYAWCTCQKSVNQPFCDGSHKGGEFKPMVFKVEETKEYAICGCRATQNKPFCDGAHKTLNKPL